MTHIQTPEVSVEPTQQIERDEWHALLVEQFPTQSCSTITLAADAIMARLASQTPPATQPSATVGEVERLLAYLFGDDRNGDGLRVVDLCYTAFMNRDKPNPDDGEKSDWFNDTKPLIDKGIADMKARILATLHTPPPVATATVVDAGEITLREAARDLLAARERLGYAVYDRIDLWSCLAAIVEDAA